MLFQVHSMNRLDLVYSIQGGLQVGRGGDAGKGYCPLPPQYFEDATYKVYILTPPPPTFEVGR